MSTVLTVLDGHDEAGVTGAAAATGRLLGAEPAVLRLAPHGRDRADEVVAAMDAPGVAAAAMSARSSGGLCWDVMARATKPILIVPLAGHSSPRIERILLPLDGDPGTAASVEHVVELATAAGIDVHPLHVFDTSTTPAFWDQAAHSHAAWEEEFRRRNVPDAKEVVLRHGDAAEEVLDAAASAEVDLVVIGWGRELGEGRAHVVRRAITEGSAPVLLVGVSGS